jgi:hypothetical protein
MSAMLSNVFADTAFWIALVIKRDQYHQQARQWSLQIAGRITTTIPVLIETANALSKPAWRRHAVALIDHLQRRSDVVIVELSPELWRQGWELYRERMDKSWSLTDCVSFVVMRDAGLVDALTTDEHFQQAGFRTVLLDEP